MGNIRFIAPDLSKKLEPCPFCGGEAQLIFHSVYFDDNDPDTVIPHIAIECTKCPAQMSITDTLINHWNKRTKVDGRSKKK